MSGFFRFLIWTVILFAVTTAIAGTFKNPMLLPTTFDPIGVAMGDFNRDGFEDLVYVDGTGARTLHVLAGRGDGTFAHEQDLALDTTMCGYLRCSLTVGDLNNDGNNDLVIGGFGTNYEILVSVLLANGDGTFQAAILSRPPSVSANGYGMGQFAIGDLNGDGLADVVVPDSAEGRVYVWLGDGAGHLRMSAAIFDGTYPSSAFIYDLNGDDRPDIVSVGPMGAAATVYLGKGDGTFQGGVRYQTSAGMQNMLLADADGDGHPDLLANVYPGQIYFLKGNADGTFAAAVALTQVPVSGALVGFKDYNGDGIPDLVLLNMTGVGILPNTGGLSFGPMVSSVGGAWTTPNIVEADFDRDGHADIAYAAKGGIVLLKGKGDATFESADFYDLGKQVGPVAVADFNADGRPDIAVAVAAATPRLLLGAGSGKFQFAPDPNATYGSEVPAEISAGDFNGDRKKDLMLIQTQNPSGTPNVLFGDGKGGFSTPLVLQDTNSSTVDLNNDGRTDTISISGPLVAYLGQANSTFTKVTTTLRNPTYALTAIGDLNKDGKADVVLSTDGPMQVWLGNGNGAFTYASDISSSAYGQNGVVASSKIADLDGDGNPDLVVIPPYPNQVMGTPNLRTIYYGNGDGTFQDPVQMPMSHSFTHLSIADLNGDGKPDLVLDDGYVIAVVMNLGGRHFESETRYVAGATIAGLTVADINGDGFPDIVAGNSSGTTVTVLLNEPSGTPGAGEAAAATFTITPEPSEFGAPFTLTMTAAAPRTGLPAPTGSVSFNVDGAFLASVPVVDGAGSYTVTSPMKAATHTIVATYDGDATYRPASLALQHTIKPPIFETQTVLTAEPNPLFTSQTVRLTAKVTSAGHNLNGWVTFLDGNATLSAQYLDNNGVALSDTTLLSAGTHNLSAVYHGYKTSIYQDEEIYSPSTSAPLAVIVNSTPTTTSVSASTASPVAGTVVTLRAMVTAGSGVPFGGAAFYDGKTHLGSVSLGVDGTGSFSTASLPVGTHHITATFLANATFASSTSTALDVTVAQAASSASSTWVAMLGAAQDDSARNNTVVKARVGAIEGSPSGRVTFLDGGAILGSAEIDAAGVATLPFASSVGTHVLRASFGGDARFAPSVSPALNEVSKGSGPEFFVAASPSTLDLAASAEVAVTVNTGGAFQGRIDLGCADGVPAGYACAFSPASLNGSGRSTLTLRRTYVVAGAMKNLLFQATFALMGLCLVAGGMKRRRASLVGIVAATAIALAGLVACGVESQKAQPAVSVLTIQAQSTTASGPVVHSTQVPVVIAVSK